MILIRLSECSEAQLDYVLGNVLGIGPVTRWRMPTPIAHGERRGATQHRRRGIPLCGPCLAAENAYKRQHDRRTGRVAHNLRAPRARLRLRAPPRRAPRADPGAHAVAHQQRA